MKRTKIRFLKKTGKNLILALPNLSSTRHHLLTPDLITLLRTRNETRPSKSRAICPRQERRHVCFVPQLHFSSIFRSPTNKVIRLPSIWGREATKVEKNENKVFEKDRKKAAGRTGRRIGQGPCLRESRILRQPIRPAAGFLKKIERNLILALPNLSSTRHPPLTPRPYYLIAPCSPCPCARSPGNAGRIARILRRMSPFYDGSAD